MVNIQGGTRVTVNRYIELLRSRIQCAPTRHITNRRQRLSSTRCQYLEQEVREREKADTYNNNKRRSMWEQSGGRFSETKDHMRVDTNQYRPKELQQRTYNCTWTDFPENVVEKQCNPQTSPSAEEAPHRRKFPEDRPITAKPFEDEAATFINQWDSNSAMVYRNKYLQSTDSCPPPVVNLDRDLGLRDRKRQFHY